MEQNSSGVGVLDKAVAILAASVGGASLATLAERADLARATAHRIAAALEHHRLLYRDVHGRWHPGSLLAELAAASIDPLVVAATPILTALRDTSGESAQLFVRRGSERVCIAGAERASGLRDTIPIGATLPLTAGSAAHVLLAWESPVLVAPLLEQAQFGARALADVRRRGWSYSVAEREAGVASVSAPVRGSGGGVIAAVSISGPIERLTKRPGDRYADAVLDAAGALSAVTG